MTSALALCPDPAALTDGSGELIAANTAYHHRFPDAPAPARLCSDEDSVRALDEARAVLARTDLPDDAPMRKAHGLPELMRHLKGEISLAEAVRIGQMNTRHYAKRQTTWFRNQVVPDLIVENDPGRQENFNLEAEIFPFIVRYLLTARGAAV